jgi:site-specific DNA recombinase
VCAIFQLYTEHRALIPVVTDLNGRGWTTKSWTTRDGKHHPGRPFTKNSLFRLLTNVLYTGKIRHKGAIYPGEQAPILDISLWQQVQDILARNGVTGGREIRNRCGATLKGILHCASCGTAMLHTYTARRGRRYRYYVCLTAQQRGWKACATKSVNAYQIEQSIVGRVRALATDPGVAAETCRRVQDEQRQRSSELRKAVERQRQECKRVEGALRQAISTVSRGARQANRVLELEKSVAAETDTLNRLSTELAEAEETFLQESDIYSALQVFDPVWASLRSEEQAAVIRALIERIDYDGPSGRLTVQFRSTALKTLCGRRIGEHPHAG